MILFSGLTGISCIPVFIGFLIKFKSELRVIRRVSWKAALTSEFWEHFFRVLSRTCRHFSALGRSVSLAVFHGPVLLLLSLLCGLCAGRSVGFAQTLTDTHPPHRLASLP